MRLILDNIEDGVALIDTAGKIVIFNPAAGRIIGRAPREVLGKNWSEILRFVDSHGLALTKEMQPISRALVEQKSIREKDAYLHTLQEARIPVHVIVTPLAEAEQHGQSLVLVIREMSLEKEAEAAKTDFVSTASHEMRTPLAALEGYITLILEQSADDTTKEYAKKAHQNIMHLGKLFQNLLTTTQSEDGQLSHTPQVFLLNELCQQIVSTAQAQAANKQIRLSFDQADHNNQQAYNLEADPVRIHELLSNVLDNALKYTDPGGEVKLSLRRLEDFVQIKIADTGYGVSPKDLPHLFQKFYRVDNNQPGTGLGLFICKKIVELYGGDIWLESEVGHGSIFCINLPLHLS